MLVQSSRYINRHRTCTRQPAAVTQVLPAAETTGRPTPDGGTLPRQEGTPLSKNIAPALTLLRLEVAALITTQRG